MGNDSFSWRLHTHFRVSCTSFCMLVPRLPGTPPRHTFYTNCGKRNGDWLVKYLPKRDTTTSSHISRAKTVTWLPRQGLCKETGNVWGTVLEITIPYEVQQCVALGGMDSTLLQHSVGPLSCWVRPPTHCSGPRCQKDQGLSCPFCITLMNWCRGRFFVTN